MLSLIHTPIEDREAALALKLTPQWYSIARRQRALTKTYSDYNDDLSRLHRHNTSDLLHFSIASTLGWPALDLSLISDDVDFVLDVIAEIWEQFEAIRYHDAFPNTASFIMHLTSRISASPELNGLLDAFQRASLIERIKPICTIIELIILRSQAVEHLLQTT